jgi:hypothetical protein
MKTAIRLLPLLVITAALQQGALGAHGTDAYTNIRTNPLDDQAPAPGGRGRGQGPQVPVFTSPDVSAERRVTFRLYAPDATTSRRPRARTRSSPKARTASGR